MPAQRVAVGVVAARCFVQVEAGADVHEQAVPVPGVHLRIQALLLIGAGVEKAPELGVQGVHARLAVQAAVVADQVDIGLYDAVHGCGRHDSDAAARGDRLYQRLVKIFPVLRHRVPLLLAAQQVTAPLGILAHVVHKKIPPAKMQEQEIVPQPVGTAGFGHDIFHKMKACLGEPVRGVVSPGQLLFRSGPAEENAVPFICIEPRLDGGQRQYVLVVHGVT